MAIAFDNSSSALETNTGTSLTYSYTVTGSNMFMTVAVVVQSGHTATVTYNAVSMTATSDSPVTVSGDSYTSYLFYLFAPATGAHNVVVTPDSSSEIYSRASSYSGVLSVALDAHGTSNTVLGTSLAVTLATTQDNCWIIGTERSGGSGTISAGANTTFRGGTSHVADLADTNAAQTPAGSYSLNMSVTGVPVPISWIALSISPTLPSTGPANVKTWDGVTQSTGIKTYYGVALASVKSVNGVT